MQKIKLGIEFFISAFIAMIAAALLLCIITQQETVDKACVAIENYDQDTLVNCVDKIWNIDAYGTRNETMFMVACESGNEEAIEYLLNQGADPNKTVPGQLTPLELFCNNGYEAGEYALSLLLKSGVKQSAYSVQPAIFYLADNYYWMTPEQKVLATEQSILLLQHGAPLGYEDTSLLHLAAKSNMYDLFYTIVHTNEGLYMMTMKDVNGQTPWDVAVSSGSIDVQKIIRNLENEYDSDVENDVLQSLSPTEPPMGSIDNPYPDDYFDTTSPSNSANSYDTIS
jgi:hypothetical protein